MQGAEKVSADKFKFHQMESCESLETMLEKYGVDIESQYPDFKLDLDVEDTL